MKAIIFDYGGKPCQIELLDKIYDKVYSSFTEEGIPSWHNEFGASCILCKLARSSCGECVLVTVTGRSCVEIEQVRAAVDARYTVLDRLSPLMYAEAERLQAEARKIFAEGIIAWTDVVLREYGNVTIEYDVDNACIVDGKDVYTN